MYRRLPNTSRIRRSDHGDAQHDDMSRLRQHARKSLLKDPSTKVSPVVTIASLGEQLHARQSSRNPLKSKQSVNRHAGSRQGGPRLSLVKPKTKIAELGLERWIAKSELMENPVDLEKYSLLSHALALMSPLVLALLGKWKSNFRCR